MTEYKPSVMVYITGEICIMCRNWTIHGHDLDPVFSLPYVIGRMGKTRQPTDTSLFCAVALDFCNQLTDDDDSGVTGGDLVHHFLATFQRVAQTESTYADLLTCCSSQSRRAVATTHKTWHPTGSTTLYDSWDIYVLYNVVREVIEVRPQHIPLYGVIRGVIEK